MDSLPDVVFIIDVGHEEIAVKESRKLGIPVVAVVDTNCSPEGVDYPIPGNDDAMRAIQLYVQGIADAVLDGKASIPDVPTGDDEFVELDEEGRPKVETGRARAKKATSKKRPRVTKVRAKAASPAGGGTEPAAESGASAAESGARAADAAGESSAPDDGGSEIVAAAQEAADET
jgi:small subunit ribosomal protein S2